MELPFDDRILETLNLGLTLSPTLIAENIGRSGEETRHRLRVLATYELVESVATDRYEITATGREYLACELDASHLDADG